MTSPSDDMMLKETVNAYVASGRNESETARVLGLARSTIQNRLQKASRRGLFPSREWAETVPPGFSLDGVSTYVHDGEPVGQWLKANRDKENMLETIQVIHDAFTDMRVMETPITLLQRNHDDDLCTVYMLADHHLGMYSWAKETGENYDSKISEQVLVTAMDDLVATTPNAETAVVLNLGDFFHTDNDKNRTKTGNALDTDTRFGQVLKVGIDLTIRTIELALVKHKTVAYRALGGNHDPYASLALALAVGKYFEKEPRVGVSTDPSYFWVKEFGKTMMVATHGDMARPEDMPGVAASKWPDIWGRTRFRYAWLGHVHHRSKGGGEKAGLYWETFQSLAAKDSWHAQMGYSSGRSMTAITVHKTYGERFRTMHSFDFEMKG